jgi:hypothetical protein
MDIMKSIGEIMRELGFNPDSSPEVQKAFVKHLVKEAQANELKLKENPQTDTYKPGDQLSFDLGEPKKVS